MAINPAALTAVQHNLTGTEIKDAIQKAHDQLPVADIKTTTVRDAATSEDLEVPTEKAVRTAIEAANGELTLANLLANDGTKGTVTTENLFHGTKLSEVKTFTLANTNSTIERENGSLFNISDSLADNSTITMGYAAPEGTVYRISSGRQATGSRTYHFDQNKFQGIETFTIAHQEGILFEFITYGTGSAKRLVLTNTWKSGDSTHIDRLGALEAITAPETFTVAEADTGRRMPSGDIIYRQVVTGTGLTDNTTMVTGVKHIVHSYGYASDAAGGELSMPYSDGTNELYLSKIPTGDVRTSFSGTFTSGYEIIVEYTKL